MHRAVGIAGDAHGEAGHDEDPRHGIDEGQGSQRHYTRTRATDGVVAGDGGQTFGGLGRLDQLRGAPTDQGEPGPVEEDGGAPVELEGVGSILQRHAAGVELVVHVIPVRVAMRSWLRPPARGRMPTVEYPAWLSMRRRTGAAGR